MNNNNLSPEIFRMIEPVKKRGVSSRHSKLYKTNRWATASRAFLSKHPLCVMCEKLGRITVSEETDHIVPHRGDLGLFWDPKNWQALCKSCHSYKTSGEVRAVGKFPPLNVNKKSKFILVCGSSGVGRHKYIETTIKEKYKDYKIVIHSHALIAQKATGLDLNCYEEHWQYASAVHQRNDAINSIKDYNDDTLHVIVLEAPSISERRHWQKHLNVIKTYIILKEVNDISKEFKEVNDKWMQSYVPDMNDIIIKL